MPGRKVSLSTTVFLIFLIPLSIPAAFALLLPVPTSANAQEQAGKRGELPPAQTAPSKVSSSVPPKKASSRLPPKPTSDLDKKPVSPSGKLSQSPETKNLRPLNKTTAGANRPNKIASSAKKKPVVQTNRAVVQQEPEPTEPAENNSVTNTVPQKAAEREVDAEVVHRDAARVRPERQQISLKPAASQMVATKPTGNDFQEEEERPASVQPSRRPLVVHLMPQPNSTVEGFATERELPTRKNPVRQSNAVPSNLVPPLPTEDFVAERELPTPARSVRQKQIVEFTPVRPEAELLMPPATIDEARQEELEAEFNPSKNPTPSEFVKNVPSKSIPELGFEEQPGMGFEDEPPEPEMVGVNQAYFEDEPQADQPSARGIPNQLALQDKARPTITPVPEAPQGAETPAQQPTVEQQLDLLAHQRPIGTIDVREAVRLPPLAEGDSPDVLQPSNQAHAYLKRREPNNVGAGPWNIWQSYRDSYPFYHKPLYFEDPNLERCGRGFGPFTSAVSAGHFALNVPILPYRIGAEPPCRCVRSLHDCNFCERFGFKTYLPPFSFVGIGTQAAATVGLVYLIP